MSVPTHPAASRLSLWAAAWVIARRDFRAVLFSRAFLFFLLGPLFPLAVGGLAGTIGSQVSRAVNTNIVALAMAPDDSDRMIAAAQAMDRQMGWAGPVFAVVPPGNASAILSEKGKTYAAVVAGTLESPRLVGPQIQIERWRGPVALIAAEASGAGKAGFAPVSTEVVRQSAAAVRSNRVRTAEAAQLLLFLLTMLLAGMVLSNLVEEKANKIIEVLAAALPMEAVFLGKLFAMLGVSLVGIAVWASAAGLFLATSDVSLAALPAPALGWPLFVVLGVAYFAMAYLLLGALFLSIGALATTVREVQTLSMPITMLQLLVFFASAFTLAEPESLAARAAIVFPLSSPFAMVARAALDSAIWPHIVALAWQGVCVFVITRIGSAVFRKRVMKSGPARRHPLSRNWLSWSRARNQ